jgi:hypothetical protein
MSTMQAFYSRLSLADAFTDAYWASLAKLSRISLKQASAFKTLITWDNWI